MQETIWKKIVKQRPKNLHLEYVHIFSNKKVNSTFFLNGKIGADLSNFRKWYFDWKRYS